MKRDSAGADSGSGGTGARWPLVVVRGGGEMGTGAARRLALAGFPVVVLEQERPTCVRWPVCFATAVEEGNWEVEGVRARRCADAAEARRVIGEGAIAILVDPEGVTLKSLRPEVLVEARMAKRNLGLSPRDAPVVVVLGPGYRAPDDCHFVVETQRGPNLGRPIERGAAVADTGIPAPVEGVTAERVLRAHRGGRFVPLRRIGERVVRGEVVGKVEGLGVRAEVDGVVRGLLRTGTLIVAGGKVGDIDPRGDPALCERVSDKANAVGGGVLEAVFRGLAGVYGKQPQGTSCVVKEITIERARGDRPGGVVDDDHP